jgi:hypothetical protein
MVSKNRIPNREKKASNGILSQNNNLQEELTIEESIFASDNETLKVIEAYEKH